MTEQRPDERVEPTREQVDEAWNRLSERVEEEPLAYSSDLLTIADGLAFLRARAERAGVPVPDQRCADCGDGERRRYRV